MRKLACVVAIALFAAWSFAETFTGTVTNVPDGDTIRVAKPGARRGDTVKIRLHGIDCPEAGQRFGEVAKKFTNDAVYRRSVTVQVRDTDQFGRAVAWVSYVDDKGVKKELNLELVKAGLAWWYEHFAPKETRLRDAQEEARKAKKGLWADFDPVAPWDWKKGK
jgi:endonuclease YncB( thermonuclease family)